jgi:hypothetical protein
VLVWGRVVFVCHQLSQPLDNLEAFFYCLWRIVAWVQRWQLAFITVDWWRNSLDLHAELVNISLHLAGQRHRVGEHRGRLYESYALTTCLHNKHDLMSPGTLPSLLNEKLRFWFRPRIESLQLWLLQPSRSGSTHRSKSEAWSTGLCPFGMRLNSSTPGRQAPPCQVIGAAGIHETACCDGLLPTEAHQLYIAFHRSWP